MAKTWLGDFTWALPAVGLIGTWITFGLCVVLFLAGAQRIPTELYEAARVDGAGFLREFFAVTLPGLRNELVVAATLTTITALRNFDIIYNTTAGGPGGETEVPSWLMFHNAFDLSRVGFAASIAVVLTIIITAVALAHRQPLEAHGVTARLDRYTTYVVLVGFSLLALYPMLSILFLAFHKKSDLVTGFSLPDHLQPPDVRRRLERGQLRSGHVGELPGRDDGDRRLGRAVAVHGLRVRHDALPRLRPALQPDRGRADLPLRGHRHPALLRLPQLPPGRHQPRGLLLGADPAADRAVGHAWHVLDARVLPDHAEGAGRGRPDRRRRLASASCAASCCPQARPALLTLCLLVFIYTWNEFLLALVLLAGLGQHDGATRAVVLRRRRRAPAIRPRSRRPRCSWPPRS